MWYHIKAFETKVRLWTAYIKKENYSHFPTLEANQPTSTVPFLDAINNLSEEFSTRFSDFRSLEIKLKLFSTPFDLSELSVPINFQMEIIELKCNDNLKSKFNACKNVTEFYKNVLPSKDYPNLSKNAKKLLSMFGSTYLCEQLFSSMKFTKNKLRTKIMENHLNNVLKIASSSISPDISKLA